VSGEALARETNVSLRTIRRDIATLQGMGVHIDGEAGVGYMPGGAQPRDGPALGRTGGSACKSAAVSMLDTDQGPPAVNV